MKTKILFLISFLTMVCIERNFGQTADMSITMPYTGSASHITCSDWFYDYGHSGGNYSSSSNASLIICPNIIGQYVSLTFTMVAFADAGDILRIYSGNNASGPLLATYTFGSAASAVPVISTDLGNGCLTATFISNASGVAGGWDANIECSVTPSANDIEIITNAVLQNDGAGNYFLNLNLDSPSSFTLNIFTVDGKIVSEEKYELDAGHHNIALPTREVAEGIYFVQLKSAENSVTKKLVVAR